MEHALKYIDCLSRRIMLFLWIFIIFISSTGSTYYSSNINSKEQGGQVFNPIVEEELDSEAPPQKDWRDNIQPEPEHKIFATWAYRPQKFQEKPIGVNVLAPIWLFVVDENDDNIPRLKHIAELGRNADYTGYVAQAHEAGAKVWGTIVSFESDLTDILIHTPEYRQKFINKMIECVNSWNLDGINFDFENMNPRHKLDFTDFIRECAEALRAIGRTISVDVTVKSDVPEPNNWYQCYDHESLGEVVDYVAVMTYDQHSHHSGAGPVASLDWVERKLQGILEDVPSDKILLGIPFYGRDFPSLIDEEDPENLIPTWSSQNRSVVTIFKSHVDQLLESDKFTDTNKKEIEVREWLVKNEWIDELGVHYIKFVDQENKVHEIWYDEEKSLALKASLVKKYHLAGVAVWQQAYGRDSFWEAISNELWPPEEISNEDSIEFEK